MPCVFVGPRAENDSMVVLTFSVLDREEKFGGKFSPTIQNCQFRLNLVPKLIRICKI